MEAYIICSFNQLINQINLSFSFYSIQLSASAPSSFSHSQHWQSHHAPWHVRLPASSPKFKCTPWPGLSQFQSLTHMSSHHVSVSPHHCTVEWIGLELCIALPAHSTGQGQHSHIMEHLDYVTIFHCCSVLFSSRAFQYPVQLSIRHLPIKVDWDWVTN
jgi:hypothetical protein